MKQIRFTACSGFRKTGALRAVGLIAMLAAITLLSACYWQPNDAEAGLAVTLLLPEGFDAAEAGEIGALQEGEDDSFVILIALDDRFIIDSEQFYGVLGTLILESLEQAAEQLDGTIQTEFGWSFDLSGTENDSLYTGARAAVGTFVSDYEAGNSGFLVFPGLRADSRYIVYAYIVVQGATMEYEGISRRRVEAGTTSTVNIDLSTDMIGPLEVGFSPVFQYMDANYGLLAPEFEEG